MKPGPSPGPPPVAALQWPESSIITQSRHNGNKSFQLSSIVIDEWAIICHLICWKWWPKKWINFFRRSQGQHWWIVSLNCYYTFNALLRSDSQSKLFCLLSLSPSLFFLQIISIVERWGAEPHNSRSLFFSRLPWADWDENVCVPSEFFSLFFLYLSGPGDGCSGVNKWLWAEAKLTAVMLHCFYFPLRSLWKWRGGGGMTDGEWKTSERGMLLFWGPSSFTASLSVTMCFPTTVFTFRSFSGRFLIHSDLQVHTFLKSTNPWNF